MSSGVEFDEDNLKFQTRPMTGGGIPGSPAPSYGGYAPQDQDGSRMVRWLMAKGIVKSPNVGQAILIAVVIINVIITFVVITRIL